VSFFEWNAIELLVVTLLVTVATFYVVKWLRKINLLLLLIYTEILQAGGKHGGQKKEIAERNKVKPR